MDKEQTAVAAEATTVQDQAGAPAAPPVASPAAQGASAVPAVGGIAADGFFHYRAEVDLEGFRELFLAQQSRYLRKLGCGLFLLCGVIAVVGSFVVAESFNLEGLAFVVLMYALTIMGLAMAIRPFTFLSTRAGTVCEWFATHGAAEPQDGSLSSLYAAYEVSLEGYGFTETSPSVGRLPTPWFFLSGRRVDRERGSYFTVDDGKESSFFYNMLGNNWALREESALSVLFVPRAVADANPGLLDSIEQTITAARQSLANGTLDEAYAEGLKAWAQI